MLAIRQILYHFFHEHKFHIIAFALLFIFYWPARFYIITDDSVVGLYFIKTHGLDGWKHSYENNTFYHTMWLSLYGLFSLFGSNENYWYIYLMLVHFGNAILLFSFLKKLFFAFFGNNQFQKIAFWSSIIFLISPLAVENYLWMATHHYGISSLLFLFSLHLLIKIKQQNFPIKRIILFHVVFVFNLLMFEITLLFPAIYFGIIFLLIDKEQKAKIIFKTCIKILLPNTIFILAYLVILHSVKHVWIPHFRPASASPELINILYYFLRSTSAFLSFAPCMHFEYRNLFFNTNIAFCIMLLVLFFVSFFIIKNFKQKGLKLFLVFLACAILTMFITSHNGFVYRFRVEGTRYFYYFSMFAFPLMLFIIFSFRFYKIFLVLFFSFILVAHAAQLPSIISASQQDYTDFKNLEKTKNQKILLCTAPYAYCDLRMYNFCETYRMKFELKFGKAFSTNFMVINQLQFYFEKQGYECIQMDSNWYNLNIKSNYARFFPNGDPPKNIENAAYQLHVENAETLQIKVAKDYIVK